MEATENVDVALTIRKSHFTDDWYLIERAKHDGREWLEKYDDGATFMHSARISNADIEGTSDEMLAVANAIETRDEFRAKRCAVKVVGDRVLLWSPRNSRKAASVPLAVADALVAQIRATLS